MIPRWAGAQAKARKQPRPKLLAQLWNNFPLILHNSPLFAKLQLTILVVQYSGRGATMGRRDYRHREPKKLKKDTKKISATTILPSPITVEVVKKKQKEEE